ncbi:hypothetical protein IWW50_004234 [Coemansia erecta]|nr:hypothetical protein IWW50_004234 [Coemansia erecta]
MKLLHVIFAALAVLGTGSSWQARADGTTQYSDELDAAGRTEKAIAKSDAVVELDRQTYRELLKTRDSILVEFYANWCKACQEVSPEFNAFAEAARKKYPDVVVARADITAVEYLASSFMVSMLPELVFIHRPAPGATPEVRYVSAAFKTNELLAYIGGGWAGDEPSGGYTSLWCTPTNVCGHIGGMLGELVVVVDRRFNPFDIPPWSFMAIIVSVLYLVGQIGIGYLARALRRWYHGMITQDDRAASASAKPVLYDEYRSDIAKTPSKTTAKSPSSGSATKRTKGKRSKKT